MATVIEPASIPGEQRFLLNGVAWETYCALIDDEGLAAVRLTYDNGALELMSPSETHEYYVHLLRRFVEAMTEELGIKIRGSRSTTLRREMLKRGLEADESYYIQNEAAVRGNRKFDFDVDPPPDLAIEVEITKSILDKIDVYRALKIPEIWRFNGKRLIALVLNDDEQYVEQETSAAFPGLALKSLAEWIARSEPSDEQSEVIDENSLIGEFRQWVRDNIPGERPA